MMQRFALVFACGLASAHAMDAHTSVGVSVTVNAVSRLDVQSMPTEVRLSATDVRRGFVDVVAPAELLIRSNSARGYIVNVRTVAPKFPAVIIRGFAEEVALGAAGGMIVQRWQHPQPVNLSLQFRFMLAPGFAPGRYPWPLRMDVRPLESG